MNDIISATVQGENIRPNTEPRLVRVRSKRKLCSHICGLSSHVSPAPAASAAATGSGMKSQRRTNAPQEKEKPNRILSASLNLEIGIRYRITPNKTTRPKK